MKQLLVVIILFCCNNSFAQDTIRVSKKVEKDYVMLEGYYDGVAKCRNMAIKIFADSTLQIDSCYNIKSNIFKADTDEIAKPISTYMELYNYNVTVWESIKQKLDEEIRKNPVDYISFKITVFKSGTEKVHYLPRFEHITYPLSVVKTMKILEVLFPINNDIDVFNR